MRDIKEIISDESTTAAVLLAAVMKLFKDEDFEELFAWDPLVLRIEIKEATGVILTDKQSDKIHAAITVLSTDLFEAQWEVFEKVCHLFNNQETDFSTLDPLSAEEMTIGVAQATLIRHEAIDYDSEVLAYQGVVLKEYGFSKPPELFPKAIIECDVECDNTDHNEALMEVFDNHLSRVKTQLKELENK